MKSTIRWNMSSMWSAKPSLKRVKRGASGTFEKPQKSWSSLQRLKRRMSRDGEELLEDKGGKEVGKGVIPFPAKALVKDVIEDRRDKLRDIEMFIKELEKGRGIVQEQILAV